MSGFFYQIRPIFLQMIYSKNKRWLLEWMIINLFVLIKGLKALSQDGATNSEPLILNWRLKNGIPLVEVSIGTPAKKFRLQPVVDASYLWVTDKLCKDCLIDASQSSSYDASSSNTSSLQNSTFVSVGDGSGRLYNDKFSIDSLHFQQLFASMNVLEGKLGGSDGVLGLGCGTDLLQPFNALTNAHPNGKLVMLKIDQKTHLLTNERNGALVIGPKMAESLKISYTNVIAKSNWHFGIKNTWVGVKSRRFQITNDKGTIQLGRTNTIGPRLIVHLLVRAVGAVPFGSNGQYYVSKPKIKLMPAIHFELDNGLKFTLDSEDVLHEENDTLAYQLTNQHNVRIFALQEGFVADDDIEPSWMFGDRFLQRHPVLLDAREREPRIGFVNLRNGSSLCYGIGVLSLIMFLWTVDLWCN